MGLKNIKNNKKAYYFSLDALIAIILLIGIMMFIHPVAKVNPPEMKLQDDFLQVLSSIKVSEYIVSSGIGHSDLQDLVNEGRITNTNQSLVEALVELHSLNYDSDARVIADEIISNLGAGSNSKIGIWFDNEPDPISSYAPSSPNFLWNAKQSITGTAVPSATGENITGYSASASLKSKYDSEYFYFGGFVGQGNVTARMEIEGEVEEAYIEGVFSDDFEILVNNKSAGSHSKSSDPDWKVTPVKYSIPISDFKNGSNYIKLVSSLDFYIAGGYIRVLYKSSNNYHQKKIFYLPGIEGAINVYDSFYVPSNETNGATLHLIHKNNYTSFFTIGNSSVNITKSETEISEDKNLADYMDISSVAGKTIPIRYGLENFSQSSGGSADVILITDTSGSMIKYLNATNNGNDGINNNSCQYMTSFSNKTSKISLARCLDKNFTSIVLSNPQNRLALVAFADTLASTYSTNLSNNLTYLTNKINTYAASGGTCLCCAINKAKEILFMQSSPAKRKYIIVMTDGSTNYCCGSNCTGMGTSYNVSTADNTTPGECTLDYGKNASNNAIWSTCRANSTNLNLNVSAIGFGPVKSCLRVNTTLQAIVGCSTGTYATSQDPAALAKVYEDLASSILNVSYSNQTINATVNTTLSPDSYLEIDYPSSLNIPFGDIITTETSEFGNSLSTGTLFLPNATEYLEAKVVSYSGDLWTDQLYFMQNGTSVWKKVYNLEDYNLNYSVIGDPYMINIPKSLLIEGDNKINISAANIDQSGRIGSPHDKAIFTFVKSFVSPSPIKAKAQGCTWNITFQDDSTINLEVYADGITWNDVSNHNCTYDASPYTTDDAIKYSTKSLLDSLDFTNPKDGKIDVKFNSNDLKVSNIVWANIPFATSTTVRISVWR